MGVGSAFLFFISMLVVFAGFCIWNREDSIRHTAIARQGRVWLTRGRTLDEDIANQRRWGRVGLVAAAVVLFVAFVVLIRELMRWAL